jgi:2,3-bisphosphoglycerate-independent phosphoglycerate mutase
LIFIFLDGVGIGQASAENPFYVAKAKYLPFYQGGMILPDGTPIKAIDPLLGVAGLPQSATGQTSLYTGENIPRLLGQHKASYPTRQMRQVIYQKNLLGLLKHNGHNAVFINAYPMHGQVFSNNHIRLFPTGEFEFSPDFPELFKRGISTTSCMMVATGQRPFDEADILAERALFQDFSNRWLIQKGLQLPEFSPEKAAEILFHAMPRYDFMLFEYFQTDLYGHRHHFDQQVQLIAQLDRLIGSLISRLNPDSDTLCLTSDHGNLEDSTTTAHTLNPVPFITWGKDSDSLRDAVNCLTDITPALVASFGNKPEKPRPC